MGAISGIYQKAERKPGDIQVRRADTLDRLMEALEGPESREQYQRVCALWPEVVATGLHNKAAASGLIKKAARLAARARGV